MSSTALAISSNFLVKRKRSNEWSIALYRVKSCRATQFDQFPMYVLQGGPPLRLQREDPDAPVLPGEARGAVGGVGGDVAPLRQRDREGTSAAVAPQGGGPQRPPSQARRRPVKVIKRIAKQQKHEKSMVLYFF